MTGSHEPTPEFRAFMESEVLRALRRETRIGARARTVRQGRLRTAAVVAAALAIGVAAGAAPARFQDVQQRNALLEAARTNMRLAAMRLDLARTEFEDARRKYETGVIRREALAAAEARLRTMEMNLAKIQLNEEEIRATAAPPRDEITAPRVGDRDFVTERLHLDLAVAQQRLSAAEQRAEEQERLESMGVVTRMARLEAETELEQARVELGILAARLDQRREFLAGDVGVAEVERRLQRRELELRAVLAGHLHSLAQERVESLLRLRGLGQVSELDVKRAEVEALERAMELERIQQQLRVLRSGGEGSRDGDPQTGG